MAFKAKRPSETQRTVSVAGDTGRGGGRERRADVYIMISLVAAAFAAGSLYLSELGYAHFYQMLMPAAVMKACGLPFLDPVAKIPELTAFLSLESRTFDCASIPDDVAFKELQDFEKWHIYLVLAVALTWSVMGVSYAALSPLAGVLHAGFAGVTYPLLRQVAGRYLSTLGTLAIIVSPSSTYFLAFLRDYAKAPFVIATLLCTLIAVRSRSIAKTNALSLVSGVVLGIGIGFRSDLLVLMPLIGLTLVAFTPWRERRERLHKIGFLALFLSSFAVVGSPVLLSHGRSGALGIIAIQGLSVPFTRYLNIEPSLYDPGHIYSDELTIASVVAYGRETGHIGDNDLRNGNDVNWSALPSNDYYLEYLLTFPADLVIRTYASIIKSLNFYEMSRAFFRKGGDPSLPGQFLLNNPAVISFHIAFLEILGTLGALKLGSPLFLLMIMAMAAMRIRETIFIAVAVTYLCGYPALQFSFRHVFHLEALFWFVLLGAITTASRLFRSDTQVRWRNSLYTGLGMIFIGVGLLVAARAYQTHTVERLVDNYLTAAREPVAVTREESGTHVLWAADRLANSIETSEMFMGSSLLETEDLQLRPSDQILLDEVQVRVLIATFGGESCAGELTLTPTLKYRHTPRTWQAFDRTFELPNLDSSKGRVQILFPAFYKGSQHFAGIELPANQARCLKSLERVLDQGMTDPFLFLVIPDDWRDLTLYQALK